MFEALQPSPLSLVWTVEKNVFFATGFFWNLTLLCAKEMGSEAVKPKKNGPDNEQLQRIPANSNGKNCLSLCATNFARWNQVKAD